MAKKNRATLKTYFETDDVPTEAQFADVFDSIIVTEDDGELSNKVDKIEGKGLSTNDFTDEAASAISAIPTLEAHVTNTDNPHEVTNIQVGADAYHGIETAGVLSFDNTTHILSVATGITYWYQGTKKVNIGITSCDLDSFVTLTADTLYYVYFDDSSGTLKAGTGFNLKTTVPVATIFWNGSEGAIGGELHGYTRDLDWHGWAHLTVGARISAADFAMKAPSIASPATINISGGTLFDEDNRIVHGTQTNCRVFHQSGANTYTFVDSNSIYPTTVKFANSASGYALTDVSVAEYINMWVYASNDISRGIYSFVETKATSGYNTVALARAATPPNLSNFGLTPELKLLYRVILQGNETVAEITDYRSSASLPAGGATSPTASSVTLVPSGSVTSTNVQGAIDQLAAATGGGQSTFDCIVAPTGGDYTTLGAALVAGKKRIFVKNGTYNESTITDPVADLYVEGESWNAILNFGAGYFYPTGDNNVIKNIQLAWTTGQIYFQGKAWRIENVKFSKTGTTVDDGGLVLAGSTGGIMDKCEYAETVGHGSYCSILLNAGNIKITNSRFEVVTSLGGGIKFNSNSGLIEMLNCTIDSSGLYNTYAYTMLLNNYARVISCYFNGTADQSSISINGTANIVRDCVIENSKGILFGYFSSDNLVEGCKFSNAWGGARVYGKRQTFRKNYFGGTRGLLMYGGNEQCVIDNNMFEQNTYALNFTDGNTLYATISNNFFNYCAMNSSVSANLCANVFGNRSNYAVDEDGDVKHIQRTNVTGGSVTVGQVVAASTTQYFKDVIYPTVDGSPRVVGFVGEGTGNNNSFAVCTQGIFYGAKVDGTADIAIGDFLSASGTYPGICKKAVAGETAIAIAKEAYTTDDQNGAIKVEVISPRVI